MTKKKKVSEGELVEQWLPLVYSLAAKFRTIPPLSFDDLVQIGCVGLLYAIRGFKKDRNTKFITYASVCIKREIIREINSKKHNSMYELIKEVEGEEEINWNEILPEGMNNNQKEILKFRCKGYSLTEIAEKMGISKQWASVLLRRACAVVREANQINET